LGDVDVEDELELEPQSRLIGGFERDRGQQEIGKREQYSNLAMMPAVHVRNSEYHAPPAAGDLIE
jgi:hypothetical protein